jgi:hypothetical protein
VYPAAAYNSEKYKWQIASSEVKKPGKINRILAKASGNADNVIFDLYNSPYQALAG